MKKERAEQVTSTVKEFLVFTTIEGDVSVDVRIWNETVWLTQKLIALLFDCSTDNVGLHLKNMFSSGEVDQNAVTEEFSVTATDGKSYKTKHYNLDAIIAVGYRISSHRAIQFRQWATEQLRNYIVKGYLLDRDRLKNGSLFGKDYFEALLEEIREIRASERRFYQKITDLYSTAIDYNVTSPVTKEFFATVQNKLHYAIHGHTAAELVMKRADSEKPNMGLTTWKKAPKGKILKTDVSVAKNYLSREEVDALDRFVSMYLDYAEDQAKRAIPMTMQDWAAKLNAFLQFNERDVLKDSGKITQEIAKAFAESEFEKYRVVQDMMFESDFDREIGKFFEETKRIAQSVSKAKGKVK